MMKAGSTRVIWPSMMKNCTSPSKIARKICTSLGGNVYPAEIEKVLYAHPAVHMCAVLGLPDPKWGKVGLACVVLKAGSACTADEMMQQMRANLAPYKVPKRVEILAELPISGAGKILKRELQDRFTDA